MASRSGSPLNLPSHPENNQQLIDHPLTDELDIKIVDRLLDDPQVTSTALARDFSVVSATIGTRIRRMHDEGIARVVALTPYDAIGHDALVLAFVRLDPAYALSLDKITQAIATIPEVFVIASLLAEYQLLLWISAASLDHADQIIESKLGQIRGLESLHVDFVTQINLERNNVLSKLRGGVGSEQEFLPPLAENLSDTEKNVLIQLRTNGRQSIRQIAREVGKSERTVRTDIRAMEERKLLELKTLVFPPAFGRTQCVIIEVDIDHHYHSGVTEALRALPDTSHVFTTTGRSHRVKAVAFVNSKGALASLLNRTIAPIPGVIGSRVIHVVSGYKHDTRHVLRSAQS